MGRVLSFFKKYWLAILSGVLMGTSYIPLPPWALVFCFAPLWFFVLTSAQNWKQAFLAGWLTQFFLTLIGFYWIAYVSHEFGYLPWAVSIAVLLLFASTVHAYYAAAAALGFFLKKRLRLGPFATLIVFVCLVSISEAWWPSLFAWNLGYPWFAAHAPVAQLADTVGFLGLSFLTHCLSALFAYLWIKKDRNLALIILLTTAVFLVFLNWVGLQKEKEWQVTDSSLKVLQIQANIGNIEKLAAEKGAGFQQEIVDRFFNLTRDALKKYPDTDIIVWPESAYPDALNDFERNRKYPAQFFRFVREIKKPILTGAYSKDPPDKPHPKDYNGLFLFDETGASLSPPYHKTFLLAYGEYTPFADTFKWMAKLSPAGEGFARGPGPTVMKFRDSVIGLQICYESLSPDFTEELAKKGATWLVNLTNDSWFGPTFEPWQNLYMTLGRAIESRRPLVRSTNTGVSTSVLASGEILPLSPLFQTWAGMNEIHYLKNPPQTFYVKYGSWLPWIILLIMALTLIFGRTPPDQQQTSEKLTDHETHDSSPTEPTTDKSGLA
jgi:apolipoprotein N-acyltransferase